MKKFTIAALVVASSLGSGIVHANSLRDTGMANAQRRIHPHREHQPLIDTQKLAAEAASRVAATRTTMGLNAKQDKLWEPVASALREFSELRINYLNTRMESVNALRLATRRNSRNARNTSAADAETVLRERANNAAAESKALALIADAAEPLSKALNSRQRHLLSTLINRETSWRHPILGTSARHSAALE